MNIEQLHSAGKKTMKDTFILVCVNSGYTVSCEQKHPFTIKAIKEEITLELIPFVDFFMNDYVVTIKSNDGISQCRLSEFEVY